MANAKLDTSTLTTILIATAVLAGGALYISNLGIGAEKDLPAFFSQVRWIIVLTAATAFIVALMLSRRFDDIAAKTESERRFPPQGFAAVADGVAAPCEGEPALMVAARLRGFALLSLCFGIAAVLAGLLFALRL